MTTVRPVGILNQNYIESLWNNRSLIINNVLVTEDMINLCEDKNIVSGDILSKIRKSNNNAEKIDLIIESLQLKKSNFFNDFCDILIISGHPMISEILNGTALPDFEIDLKDMWEELPLLKKSLVQNEKDKLLKYINRKIKEGNVKSLISQPKDIQRKSSLARLNQVEQAWKFQKELKGKDQEKDELKNQLQSIEEKLLEKQNQLMVLAEDYKAKKQKQDEENLIAAKFNTANDKVIQRLERSLELYRSMVSKMSLKIRNVLQQQSSSYDKLIRESTESNIKKHDLEKQLDIFQSLIESLIDLNGNLSGEVMEFEKLKLEVNHVKQLLQSETKKGSSDSLRAVIKDYQINVDGKIDAIQQQIKIQENFIYGVMKEDEIPERYKNIEVPSKERDEYMVIITELKSKVQYLEAMLATKEKEFKSFVKAKSKINNGTVIEIIQEETDEDNYNSTKITNGHHSSNIHMINQNNWRSAQITKESPPKLPTNIPYSYSSNYVKRETKPNPNSKLKKANFLKANVVSFI